MISERQFSSKYSSVWNNLLPMSDRFMRVVNLEAYRYVDEFVAHSPAALNAFINETSFRIFAGGRDIRSISDDDFLRYIKTTKKYIEKVSKQSVNISAKLRPAIKSDIINMYARIQSYFSREVGARKGLVFNPSFAGCGLLQSCCGDVYFDKILFEVKAGDREFRAIDLRQLLTYVALNYYSHEFEIEKIGLVNPRTGKYWIGNLEAISFSIAGMSLCDLCNGIVDSMMVDRLSH